MRTVTPTDTTLVQTDDNNRYKLNRFYKRNGHHGKATSNHQAWWLEHNGDIVAALRLEPSPWGSLLRGMWVASELRGQGLGAHLLSRLYLQLSATPCFCLPYKQQSGFYHRNGFIDAQSDAPAALRQQHKHYQTRGEELGLLRYQPPCD